jgi:cell wall-associated NlpC family hydrolase
MSQQAQLVLAKAKAYVDAAYKEGPNNDTIFGKWYGLNHNPWCAMFVSKCFDEAGLVKLVAASGKKGFASVKAGLDWFTKNKQTVPVAQAQPGDVVFFNFDHVGLVYLNDVANKNLITFEGNTAKDHVGSQANGDGAYKKTRPYTTVAGIGRPKFTS